MATTIFSIEDDKDIQKDIEVLLSRRSDFNLIGFASSVKEALKILPHLKVDLVLMDIELEDGESFEILEKLAETKFEIIFVTAYNEYAIKAIKTGAIDYLLKPIDEMELNQALDSFQEKKKTMITDEQKDVLLKMISNVGPLNRIVVRTQGEIYFVELEDLVYCKGEGNYTTFKNRKGKSITSSKPLREYASILPNSTFMKIHQSYMVNLNLMDCFRNSCELLMKDGSIIPVSSRYKDLVANKFL